MDFSSLSDRGDAMNRRRRGLEGVKSIRSKKGRGRQPVDRKRRRKEEGEAEEREREAQAAEKNVFSWLKKKLFIMLL